MRLQTKITRLFFVLTLIVSSFPQSSLALNAQEWFEKGNELSQQGQFEDAIKAYQKSVEQNPLSPVPHYNLITTWASPIKTCRNSRRPFQPSKKRWNWNLFIWMPVSAWEMCIIV
jgi:tetratricopeptide (TPR) repeat protein